MGASVVKIPAALRRATPSEKIAIMGVVTASVGGALLLGGHHGLGAAILLAGIAIMSAAAPVAAIWSVLLLVPVHPLAMKTLQIAGVSGWPFLAVSAWKELALSVALVVLAASALKRVRASGSIIIGRPHEIGDYMAVSLILIVGFALILNPNLRGLNGARLILFPVGLYLALRLRPIEVRTLFTGMVIVGTAIAVFGIIQSSWLGWDFVQRYYVGSGLPMPATFTAQHLAGPRAAGTFLSPNEFAFAMASFACIATALVIHSTSRTRSYLTPVLVVLLLGVAVAFSRSALIGLVLGVVAIFFLSARSHLRQPRLTAIALLVAFIPALAISAFVYSERGGFALLRSSVITIGEVGVGPTPLPSDNLGSPDPGASPTPTSSEPTHQPDTSTIGHIDSLGQGWQLVVDHPLGLGLGNVGARPFPGSTDRPKFIVESWYLSMGLSLGWVGLIWALLFPFSLGLAAFRTFRRDRNSLAALGTLGLAALLAFVSLLLPTMMEPEVAIIPWVVLGSISGPLLGQTASTFIQDGRRTDIARR